jgi:hypothetical protein
MARTCSCSLVTSSSTSSVRSSSQVGISGYEGVIAVGLASLPRKVQSQDRAFLRVATCTRYPAPKVEPACLYLYVGTWRINQGLHQGLAPPMLIADDGSPEPRTLELIDPVQPAT